MRYGFEAQRRNRPYCMGTIYWQLNDSWPVVSWSGIDYYGNWKALHYQAKRAFEPVLISPAQKNDSLLVYLISDKLESFENLQLTMKWKDFDGKLLRKSVVKTNLPGSSSTPVFREAISNLLTPEQRKTAYVQLSLTDKKGKVLSDQIYFINKTKDLNLSQPTISVKTQYKSGYCELTLSTNKLAKDVFIEIPVQGARFSDNFFDLEPGVAKKISISSALITPNSQLKINIKHIRQTYK